MQVKSLIRACSDVHRIGKMAYAARRFVLGRMLNQYVATQKYVETFGIYTFHLVTNHSNRAWLFNYITVYGYTERQVGGFSQIRDKTYVLAGIDCAAVPAFMYPKNEDFSFLNLQTMFMWMSCYRDLVMQYGFRPVTCEALEVEYINVMEFFKEFNDWNV